MKCTQVRTKLSAYVDDELDPVRFQRIKTHLLDCQDCQGELEQMQRVDARLKKAPVCLLPDRFFGQLLNQVHNTSVPTNNQGVFFRFFPSVIDMFRDFFDHLNPPARFKTETLEEFGDFPPGSLSYAYFQLLSTLKRG